jgi:threonine aldolase
VFYDPAPVGLSVAEITDRAGALPDPLILGDSRLVVHIQTSEAAIDDFLAVIRELIEEKKAKLVKPETPQRNSVYKSVYSSSQ